MQNSKLRGQTLIGIAWNPKWKMESWWRICNPALRRYLISPGILRIFLHTAISESAYFILVSAIRRSHILLGILHAIFGIHWNLCLESGTLVEKPWDSYTFQLGVGATAPNTTRANVILHVHLWLHGHAKINHMHVSTKS